MNKKRHYNLYVLIKDKKPVYVGVTYHIPQRIRAHRLTKDFDTYRILHRYKDKKSALIAENGVIRFLSYFGGDDILNKKYWGLELQREIDENEWLD